MFSVPETMTGPSPGRAVYPDVGDEAVHGLGGARLPDVHVAALGHQHLPCILSYRDRSLEKD